MLNYFFHLPIFFCWTLAGVVNFSLFKQIFGINIKFFKIKWNKHEYKEYISKNLVDNLN